MSTKPRKPLSRRALAHGAVWAVPTVSLATAAPSFASSTDTNLTAVKVNGPFNTGPGYLCTRSYGTGANRTHVHQYNQVNSGGLLLTAQWRNYGERPVPAGVTLELSYRTQDFFLRASFVSAKLNERTLAYTGPTYWFENYVTGQATAVRTGTITDPDDTGQNPGFTLVTTEIIPSNGVITVEYRVFYDSISHWDSQALQYDPNKIKNPQVGGYPFIRHLRYPNESIVTDNRAYDITVNYGLYNTSCHAPWDQPSGDCTGPGC